MASFHFIFTMPQNNNTDVTQQLREGLKINQSFEKVPDRVAESIVPMFLTNKFIPRQVKVYDEISNDSDKIITIPEGVTRKLICGHINLATSATVGSRVLQLIIADENGVTLWVSSSTPLAASLTENYTISNDYNRGGVGTMIGIPSDLMLKPGYQIRIWDSEAVDAAADDMKIHLIFEDYSTIIL